jgi:hypothetical protein
MQLDRARGLSGAWHLNFRRRNLARNTLNRQSGKSLGSYCEVLQVDPAKLAPVAAVMRVQVPGRHCEAQTSNLWVTDFTIEEARA